MPNSPGTRPEESAPPQEFLKIAGQRSERQLESSLEWMKKEHQKAQDTGAGPEVQKFHTDMIRWTESVLEQRHRQGDQLELRESGVATRRQHEQAEQRRDFQAGSNALRGNTVSAIAFGLTKDPHLAAMLGGVFSAVGGVATGRNELRQMDSGQPAPISRPSRGGSEPQSESSPPPHGERAADSTVSMPGAGIETLTWADIEAFAEKVFGVSEEVVAAAKELTRREAPVTEATQAFLEALNARSVETGGEPGDGPSTQTFSMEGYHEGPEEGGMAAGEVEPGTGPLSNEAVDQPEAPGQQGAVNGTGRSESAPPEHSNAPASDGLGPLSEPYSPASDELAVEGASGTDAETSGGRQSVSEPYSPASDELAVEGLYGTDAETERQEEDQPYSPAPDELQVETGGGEHVEYEQVEYEQVEYEQVEEA